MSSYLVLISPKTAREVRAFVAVFAGLRRRRVTVSWGFETVLIKSTTFWSFQANCTTLPLSDRLLYSCPHSRAVFHLILSSRSRLSRPRLDSCDFFWVLVPSLVFISSLDIDVVLTVPTAPNPLMSNWDNNLADVNRLSSYMIWEWFLAMPSWATRSSTTAWVWVNPRFLI